MSETQQTSIDTFAPTTDEIEVTRTVRLKLETSERKNKLVRKGIDAYQQVLSGMEEVMVSYPEHEWEPHHSHMYHHAKRFLPEDEPYRTTVAQVAQQQVSEAFKSWRQKGKPGDGPDGDFGGGNYIGLRAQEIEIKENDRGWGIKTSFISHRLVWFHIDHGSYQAEFLNRITDDNDAASAGATELHLHDDGTLFAHQTVTWPVEVYSTQDVSTTVGVDLNDDPLAVAAVVSGDSVRDVHFESGSEFRHHRERVKEKRAEAMEMGDLRAIKDTRLMYDKYTDHVTNVVSRHVVDLAVKHSPAKIHIEDLTHYRETADDPIHDWPFAMLQERICSKAREAGVPVLAIDPRNTSVTCRKCGETDAGMRDGSEFECSRCGYQVHADVNAAINIAQRPPSG